MDVSYPTPSNAPQSPAPIPIFSEPDRRYGSQIEEQISGPAAQNMPEHIARPAPALSPLVTSAPHDIRSIRRGCQFSLREYLTLLNKRQRIDASMAGMDLEDRIRVQASLLAGDLRTLREELGVIITAAEKHRWRTWLFGGVL
jgi:hypothetical protein